MWNHHNFWVCMQVCGGGGEVGEGEEGGGEGREGLHAGGLERR